MPASAPPLEVLFLRQGGHLLAVEAKRVEEVSSELLGDVRIGFGPRLEGIFAPAERHVLRLRMPDGSSADLDVGGTLAFGLLDARDRQPLPEFVRGLARTTGIEEVFRTQECIGFLVDPWRLPQLADGRPADPLPQAPERTGP